MDFSSQYNSRNPGVKRLMREAREMQELTEDCSAAPVDDNLFEWHFTIRGAADSDFEGGLYHGRITFPTEYPMKPPHILLFTPNGRFEINKKVCLSISGHHPETWQPSWSVRTALLALIAFMSTPAAGTIGSLDYSKEERQALAHKSRSWKCDKCGVILNLLAPRSTEPSTKVEKAEESDPNNDNCENKPNSSGVTEVTDFVTSLNNENKAESTKVEDAIENTSVLTNESITSSVRNRELSNTSSNFYSSKVTVSLIVLLIALLLYRRLFLLN